MPSTGVTETCSECGSTDVVYYSTLFVWSQPSVEMTRMRVWAGAGCLLHPEKFLQAGVDSIFDDFDEVMGLGHFPVQTAEDLVGASAAGFGEMDRIEKAIGLIPR